MASGLISALGWALVHFLWQGCAIAVLYWLVCVSARRDSAHLRYWAGVGSLGLAALALVATFTVYFESEAHYIPLASAPEPVNSFLVLSGTRPDLWAMLQAGIEPALLWLVALWFGGVLLGFARTAREAWRLRRLVHDGVADAGRRAEDAARRLERQLGLARAVRVLRSARVTVPMAVGWLRPVVLIPAGVLARLPHDQLEMVLAHELGHIRRYDHLVNAVQVVLETLLFYHPAIRWISGRVRVERENCCDDLVVTRCRKPATYARALTNLELLRGPAPAAAAMAATGGDLLGRVRRIIDAELPRTSSGYAQLSLTAALALLVGLGAQQGVALSRALNQVAGTARLQPSDVEWKIRGQSWSAWGDGLAGYAARTGGQSGSAIVRAAESAAGSRLAALRPGASPALPPARVMPPPDPHARLAVAGPGLQPAPAVLERVTRAPEIAAPELPAKAEMSGAPFLPPPADVAGPSDAAADGNTVAALPEVPDVLERTEPHYPRRARVRDVEGFVQLAFSVDADGRPYDIEVVDAIPSGVFERASTRALRQWKFAPRPATGPAPRLTQTFNFDLEDTADTRRRHCMMTGRRTCGQAPSAAIVVYVNPPREPRRDASSSRLN